jgi:hypothetical protein
MTTVGDCQCGDVRYEISGDVLALYILLKFFGDGERWVKGRLSDRRGNRCLVGALDFVGSHRAIQSDGAKRYRGTVSRQRDYHAQGQSFRF